MPVSKVVLNDETMIDLTSDTITSDALIDGVTAHDAAGNAITGTLQSPADAVSQHNLDPAAHDGILEPAFTDAQDKTVSFTEASSSENISTGEKLSVLFGKIAKWFSSFGDAAWKSVGTASGTVASGDHTHSNYIPTSQKGVSGGVATLDGNTKVTPNQATAAVESISASTTLSSTHYGRFLCCSNSSAITITIPTGVPMETEIEIYREGSGAVTLSPADGVTVQCKETNYSIVDQYTAVILKWRGENVVSIGGNVG